MGKPGVRNRGGAQAVGHDLDSLPKADGRLRISKARLDDREKGNCAGQVGARVDKSGIGEPETPGGERAVRDAVRERQPPLTRTTPAHLPNLSRGR